MTLQVHFGKGKGTQACSEYVQLFRAELQFHTCNYQGSSQQDSLLIQHADLFTMCHATSQE